MTHKNTYNNGAYFSNIRSIFDAASLAKVPVIITGDPGTGKTAFIMDYTKEKEGYTLISIIGSRIEPGDIQGLPRAVLRENEIGYVTDYCIPQWQDYILQHKKVVLFLDELSNTSDAVQAAFLTILQDRRFPNGEQIPEETIILGAMNPPNSAADYNEPSLPMTNRCLLIPWTPLMSDWLEGCRCSWGKKISENEAKWRNIIPEFLKANPDLLQKIPKNSFEEDNSARSVYTIQENDYATQDVYEKAWPSRRSWDNVCKMFGHLKEDENSAIRDLILRGLVGHESAISFTDWLTEYEANMVDLKKALEKPKTIDWKEISENNLINLVRKAVSMTDEIENMDKESAEKLTTQIYDLIFAIAEAGRADITGIHVTKLLKNTKAVDQKLKMKLITLHHDVGSKS